MGCDLKVSIQAARNRQTLFPYSWRRGSKIWSPQWGSSWFQVGGHCGPQRVRNLKHCQRLYGAIL